MLRCILSIFLLLSLHNAVAQGGQEESGNDSGEVHKGFYTPPTFPGGRKAKHEFVSENFEVREENKGVDRYIVFKIEVAKDGRVTFVGMFPLCEDFEKEAKELVRKMPKWEPAKKIGEPVKDTTLIEIDLKYE